MEDRSGNQADAAGDIDDVSAFKLGERKTVAEGAADPDLVSDAEGVKGRGYLADVADGEMPAVLLRAQGQGDGEFAGPEDRAHDELPRPDGEGPLQFRIFEAEINTSGRPRSRPGSR